MPKPATHTLLWSAQSKTYALLCPDAPPQSLVQGSEEQWLAWLTMHSSFSFQGQYGRLSVLKESRQRGAGYWYAYHTKESRTRKRYIGRTAMVTFACLEKVAQELSNSSSSAFLSQAPRAPEFPQKGVLLSTKLSPPRLPFSTILTNLLNELVQSRALGISSSSWMTTM